MIQAPVFRGTSPRRFLASSFADILAIRGYAQVETLQPLVAAWRTLIERTQARLVVADHAPTLLLAAYRQLPSVVVGNGFTIPPSDVEHFPPLTAGARPFMAQTRVLEIVADVQRRVGGTVPPSLPAIFQDASRYIRTIAELDPYRDVRREPVQGPLTALAPADRCQITGDFFAYLSADYPGVLGLLRELADRRLTGGVFLRGATPETAAALRETTLRVYTSPPPLSDVLPRVRLVLHHAGLNTATIAAMIGRPQVLLPSHLEQELTARALHELGVGDFLLGRIAAEDALRVVDLVRSRERFSMRATEFAEANFARTHSDGIGRIVECCCNLLGS